MVRVRYPLPQLIVDGVPPQWGYSSFSIRLAYCQTSLPGGQRRPRGYPAVSTSPRPRGAAWQKDSIYRMTRKGPDDPEIIQAITALVVVLAANADNAVVDVLLAILVGCALTVPWRHRRR